MGAFGASAVALRNCACAEEGQRGDDVGDAEHPQHSADQSDEHRDGECDAQRDHGNQTRDPLRAEPSFAGPHEKGQRQAGDDPDNEADDASEPARNP